MDSLREVFEMEKSMGLKVDFGKIKVLLSGLKGERTYRKVGP